MRPGLTSTSPGRVCAPYRVRPLQLRFDSNLSLFAACHPLSFSYLSYSCPVIKGKIDKALIATEERQ